MELDIESVLEVNHDLVLVSPIEGDVDGGVVSSSLFHLDTARRPGYLG